MTLVRAIFDVREKVMLINWQVTLEVKGLSSFPDAVSPNMRLYQVFDYMYTHISCRIATAILVGSLGVPTPAFEYYYS